MEVTFYGVRGSLPAPATGAEIQAQIAAAVYQASQAGVRFDSVEAANHWLTANLPFHQRSSYGGDTTCILIRCGETRMVVDAGSGIRRLGRDLMPELVRSRRLALDFLFTHMHQDHVLGFPFFAPLYMPKRQFDVRLKLHGGAMWQNDLQTVLASTISAPLFPVQLDQIQQEAATIEYGAICDGFTMTLGDSDPVQILSRRLNHPQETYGWRIEYRGRVFTVATDTEPFAGPDPRLAELAAGADVIYVDCQYDWDQYIGEYDRQPRVGWGHGYAEWCGRYVAEAGARLAVMGHHDPAATNARVHELYEKMRAEFPHTVAGFDGLRLRIDDEEITAVGAGERGEDFRVRR